MTNTKVSREKLRQQCFVQGGKRTRFVSVFFGSLEQQATDSMERVYHIRRIGPCHLQLSDYLGPDSGIRSTVCQLSEVFEDLGPR